jgi:hypothetical protein
MTSGCSASARRTRARASMRPRLATRRPGHGCTHVRKRTQATGSSEARTSSSRGVRSRRPEATCGGWTRPLVRYAGVRQPVGRESSGLDRHFRLNTIKPRKAELDAGHSARPDHPGALRQDLHPPAPQLDARGGARRRALAAVRGRALRHPRGGGVLRRPGGAPTGRLPATGRRAVSRRLGSEPDDPETYARAGSPAGTSSISVRMSSDGMTERATPQARTWWAWARLAASRRSSSTWRR